MYSNSAYNVKFTIFKDVENGLQKIAIFRIISVTNDLQRNSAKTLDKIYNTLLRKIREDIKKRNLYHAVDSKL